ncbi:MAG: glycosyltransferase family 39 protein, partial [Patescibacteria group bacterium]
MLGKYKIAVLVFIIVLAVFFRFWQFSSIPVGLYQDEAMNGSDALSSLKTGEFKAFYTNNNGREGLIVWLDALAIKAFGTEPWVLRLFPAIAGLLAVLGLYFLAKELFNTKVALVSSLFMATSFWAVNFSRTGFRAALMVPILIWAFYFLLKGFRLHKYIYFIVAGALFGLGFYTYISFRFAPILALLAFAPLLFKKSNKKLWFGILVFIGVTFLVALPIGMYFLNNPGDFFGRSSSVSIFSQDSPLIAVTISAVKALGMFNIAGDFNWRHNYAGFPELFFPVGILFLLGVYFSAKRRSFEDKFTLLWLVIFLLPNILTIEGNP